MKRVKEKLFKRISIFTVMAMILTNICASSNLLYAQEEKEPMVAYEVQMGNDNADATIHFAIDAAKEHYEIKNIISLKEQSVVYDADKQLQADYTVHENGKYAFQITYRANEEKAAAEDKRIEEKPSEETNGQENIETEVKTTEKQLEAYQQDTIKIAIQDIKAKTSAKPKQSVKQSRTTAQTVKKTLNKSKAKTPVNKTGKPSSKSMPSANGLAADGAIIDLEDVFNITGNQSLGYDSIAKVTKNSIKLSNQNLSNNFPYQSIGMTSKTKISFMRSWKLEGTYAQALAPDGVSFSFHNDAGFDASINKGGALGIYKQLGPSSSEGDGLLQGLAVELDPYANKGDTDDAFINFSVEILMESIWSPHILISIM